MDAPQNAGEVVSQFEQLKQDLAALRALKGLKILTASGQTSVRLDDGGGNAVIDLRSSTQQTSTGSGSVSTVLPSQTGNAGKILTTDGTNLVWA